MHKFANRLLKNYRNILSIILTFTLLFPNLIAPIGVLPVFADNPSNEALGWAHYDVLDVTETSATLRFISTRGFYSCFEYRAKDEPYQSSTNPNTTITDGLWKYECVNNSTTDVTVDSIEFVEVRMVFGAESDERFDWERVDLLVAPDSPTLLSPSSGSVYTTSQLPKPQTWTAVPDAVKYIYNSYTSNPELDPLTPAFYSEERNVPNRTIGNTAPEGKYWWRVMVVDSNGLESEWSEAWTFIVDNTKPVVELLNPLLDNEITNSPIVTRATDNVQLRLVTVNLYNADTNALLKSCSQNVSSLNVNTYDLACDTSTFVTGNYYVKTNARDMNTDTGNLSLSNTITRNFKIDKEYPVITETKMFVNGVESWLVKPGDSVRIEVNAVDNLSPVDKIQLWVREYVSPYSNELSSGLMSHVSGDTWEYTYAVPTTYNNGNSLNEGFEANYFNFRPYDTLGNNHIGWRHNFTIDATDPVVDITSHTNGNIVTGNINIAGTVSDTNLWRYYFVIRNASNATIAGPGTVYNAGPLVNVNLAWDTTLVPDGTYKIRLEARDIADNKGAASTEVVTIVVDNSAPTTPKLVNTPFVTHNGDIAGTNVRNEVKFSESIDPSGVLRYEYQFVRMDLNGTKLQSGLANMNTYLGGISCVTGVCTWKPDYQNNNQWVFRIRAIDTVGNISDWSNWNDASDAEFSNFSTTYSQYNLGSGIFSRPDYDGSMGNGGYAVRESLKPTSSITAPTGIFNTNDPNINITYSASDAQTEVKNVKLYSQAGDLLATSTSGEFDITLPSVDGSYCMYTRAEDIADDKALDLGLGNIEDIDNNCELEVRLDVNAPVIGEITFVDDFMPYVLGDITGFQVLAPVSDSFSGINELSCKFTFGDGAPEYGTYNSMDNECSIVKFASNNQNLTINVSVEDNVGNPAQGVAKVRTSDSANPTSEVVIDDVYSGPNVYTTGTIKGTANDDVSSVEQLEVSIERLSDNGFWNGLTFDILSTYNLVSTSSLPNWTYGGLPSTALSNGVTYLVTPMATDSVLHVATGTSDSFIWDSVAPINPTATRTSLPNLDYISADISGASDALSGVKGYSYFWSLNATDTVDETMDIDNTATSITSHTLFDGVWYLHLRTVDNVMNWSEVSSFGPYVVDTVPPVTTVSGIDSDWHNESVTVTFTCTDTDGSGCATTHYIINKDSINEVVGEGTSVVISDEGYNTVSFYSVDAAGNEEVENEHPQTVNIDITAPINPSDFISDPEINVNTQDNTVWVSWADGMIPASTELFSVMGAYDNLSGVNQYQYKFSMNEVDSVNETDVTTTSTEVTSEPLNDGLWYFHMRTEDNAGNWADTTSYGPFVIDNTKPVITRNGANVTVTQGNTYTDAGATAFDTQDGDLTAQIVTVNPVNTNVLGTYTVRYNVTDSAGNIADEVTRTVTVVAAPVVPAVVPAVQGVEEEVETEEEVVDEEENGEVLGVCTVSVKVSGYVYLDKDNDGSKGDNEDGIEGVSVVIYSKADNKEVAKVTTDKDGKWTVEVCSGQYYAKVVDPKDVKGYKIEADSNEFELKEGEELQNINFVYENTSSFNWWWLVLLALVVLAAGGYIYLTKKREEEGK